MVWDEREATPRRTAENWMLHYNDFSDFKLMLKGLCSDK